MKSNSLLILAMAVLITAPAGWMGNGVIPRDPPRRGSSAVHDSGNFSLNIGDDGGYSGWDILEFPVSIDSLGGASFGIGLNQDTVDYGDRGDFDTVESLSLNDSWSHTNETSHCVFTGWPGQDLDYVNVTQRGFMNEYVANTSGHTGRWFVVDYIIDTDESIDSDLFAIQYMDVDLSPSEDEFQWDPDYNMVVTEYGQTYIGLAYFNDNSIKLNGHNAGAKNPLLLDSEEKIYNHMESPNNQTSSTTKQNWYMDLVARIPKSTFPGEAHVSFAIVVGKDMNDLRNGVEDARAGMGGSWSSDPPENWTKGEMGLEATYDGIFWPPDEIEVSYTPPGGGSPVNVDHAITGNRTISFTINTTEAIPTQGSLRYSIRSVDPMGTPTGVKQWGFDVDNQGPTVCLVTDIDSDSGWARGSFNVIATGSDPGGSGVKEVYIREGQDPYQEASSILIDTEGDDISVSAYSVDMIGNVGPVKVLEGLKNDGTPPSIDFFGTIPENVTEDTTNTITISAGVSDDLSGINHTRSEIRWGLNSATSAPIELEWDGSFLNGSVTTSWEAAQNNDLVLSIDLYDEAGNNIQSELTELVDPLNDPPEFNMVERTDPWQKDEFMIEFVGEDPDGDEVEFDLYYRVDDDDWIPMDPSIIRAVDRFNYWIGTPDLIYEGPIEVRATAGDGSVERVVPPINISIDTKPPALESGYSVSGWTNETVEVSFVSRDMGSGLDSYWMEIGDSPSVKVEEFSAVVGEEGVTPVTAHAVDLSGNRVDLELDSVRIDMTSPSIWGVESLPEDPIEDEDLRIDFRAADNHSGLKEIPNLSLHVGTPWLSPDEVREIGQGRFTALFTSPFSGSDASAFEIIIESEDLAGNGFTFMSGPIPIRENVTQSQLNITYPDSLTVGEDWEITANIEGEVTLSVLYPGTTWDWIITPEREEGDLKTYILPAPYGGSEVSFRITYSDPEDNGSAVDWPADERMSIPILGGLDSDRDGLEDTWEESHGLDPSRKDDISKDPDGDGLNMIQEMFNLTDPEKEDTDGDDMVDGWEARNGTLPFRDDPNEDPDGDGWTNIVEYVNDARPRDPEDHPEEVPVTPWYWILIIFLVLFAIMGYFIMQMFSRKKLKEDTDFGVEEESEDWDDNN